MAKKPAQLKQKSTKKATKSPGKKSRGKKSVTLRVTDPTQANDSEGSGVEDEVNSNKGAEVEAAGVDVE
jgi:hypothetical protein